MARISLCIAGFALLCGLAILVLSLFPPGSGQASLIPGLIWLSIIWLGLVLLPLGVIFGFVGLLFQRGRSRWFALLGLTLNGALCAVPLLAAWYPEALSFTTTDYPVPWIKVTLEPAVTGLLGDVRRSGTISFFIRSNSGAWSPISHPQSTFNPRLVILSPDVVLITGIGPPRGQPKVVGEIFRRGVDTPVASIPDGNVILPIPSGGFITTRLEPDDRHPTVGIEVETYGTNGERTRVWDVAIPQNLLGCSWGPALRLVGDDPVYVAGMCHELTGIYHVASDGISLMAHLTGSVLDDNARKASLTQEPRWDRDIGKGAWGH